MNNHYFTVFFLVPDNTRCQDRQQQQQRKAMSLSYLVMVILTLEAEASFKTSRSFFRKTLNPLAIGFCLHLDRHRAILFSPLFKHLKSSPGSLSPPGKPFDIKLHNSSHL